LLRAGYGALDPADPDPVLPTPPPPVLPPDAPALPDELDAPVEPLDDEPLE
jgi:hypothetical protein